MLAHSLELKVGAAVSCEHKERTLAISPNSASCERVFALLKNLFGEQQVLALADYIQAALMLNYNQRRVG